VVSYADALTWRKLKSPLLPLPPPSLSLSFRYAIAIVDDEQDKMSGVRKGPNEKSIRSRPLTVTMTPFYRAQQLLHRR